MSRPHSSDRNVLLWVGRSLFGGGLRQCLAAGWVLCSPPRLPGCHGDVFSAGELKQKGVALQPVNQILWMLRQYHIKVWRLHNFRQLLRIIFFISHVVIKWGLRITFSFWRRLITWKNIASSSSHISSFGVLINLTRTCFCFHDQDARSSAFPCCLFQLRSWS